LTVEYCVSTQLSSRSLNGTYLVLNSKAEDMNIRVVATLVIVAHLEKGLGCSEVLL
jgi:hypothetical protein